MFARKISNYLFNSDYRAVALDIRGIHILDDEEFIKRKFRLTMGYDLDLDNPKTFNEKLQWLKLHDRKPEYTTMVDKYAAKKYIADKVGDKYVVPTLGVWERFEDINFEILPRQFVLKCTHDSGSVVICRDKKSFDYKKARKLLNSGLKKDFSRLAREWPYKDVPRRIIAEKYILDDETGELRDYKLHCINGNVKFLYITSDRFNGKGLKADYFDENFNKLDIQWELPNSEYILKKPDNFELMKSLACKLAEETIVLRVDFYEVDGKIYVGELTFYDGGGFVKINGQWDEVLGECIELPMG